AVADSTDDPKLAGMGEHLRSVADGEGRGGGHGVPAYPVGRGPYIVEAEALEAGGYPELVVECSGTEQFSVEYGEIVGDQRPGHPIARSPDVLAGNGVVAPANNPQLASEIEQLEIHARRKSRVRCFLRPRDSIGGRPDIVGPKSVEPSTDHPEPVVEGDHLVAVSLGEL